MPDMAKVIKGLECCEHLSGEYCRQCPYQEDIAAQTPPCCTGVLAHDALALLKRREPRVMTIGDLYSKDMGFFERKGEELVWPVLIARGGPESDRIVTIVYKDALDIKADCRLMNRTWRIWTSRPTKEQRDAVKWNA